MATIVRGPRAADHFTIISNHALRDQRLSWKARGLLGYLLSMDTGWQTSVRRLAEVAPDGKSSVETALAELEAAGYLERRQVRDETTAGRFGGTEYHVRDDAAVTRFPGHGTDDDTVTRFSVTGSTGPGESATKKTSPKKTSPEEDSSAARSAATATPGETSASSSSTRNARARNAAAAATTSTRNRSGATRAATPADILGGMMLTATEAATFRGWLVDATGAKNPDGLIVSLDKTGALPDRVAQWRQAMAASATTPAAVAGRPQWCGECDESTRTITSTDNGREYVRRCEHCHPFTASVTALEVTA